MIKPNARLSIAVLPLEKIQIRGFQKRHDERVEHYTRLLETCPDDYPGVLLVEPSKTHEGMFLLLDDISLFAVSLVAGKTDVLCLIIEEPGQESEEEPDDEPTTDAEETQETARPSLTVVRE